MALVSKKVVVILEPSFGERLSEIAGKQPVWLCSSPANRKAAEILWTDSCLPRDWVTLFDAADAASREVAFLDILATVDEHVPSWQRLHVVGVGPSLTVKIALAEYGNGMLELNSTGFIYHRFSD